jgi:hypothetical protein
MDPMTSMRLFRDRHCSGDPFDLNSLEEGRFVWRDSNGHPIGWFVEPDRDSLDHFYVTYLGGYLSEQG